MQGAKGSGNARKETRESRLEEKRRRGREEAEQRAWKMRDETCRWMAMAWSVPEEWTRRRRKAERGGRGEEERKGKRVREREGKRAGLCSRPSQYVLVASVCPFVPVHVRTSVRCLPWHSNRVHSRLAPVEGLWPIITWSLYSLRFF